MSKDIHCTLVHNRNMRSRLTPSQQADRKISRFISPTKLSITVKMNKSDQHVPVWIRLQNIIWSEKINNKEICAVSYNLFKLLKYIEQQNYRF